MTKFANFKVDEEEQELERLREDYWLKAQQAPPGKPIDKSTEMFVKSVILRHGWLRSRLRSDIIKNARVTRGMYQCACCKKQTFKATDLEIDHLYSRSGFRNDTNLIQWINNTFCEPQYLAAVCKICHRAKTAKDRAEGK